MNEFLAEIKDPFFHRFRVKTNVFLSEHSAASHENLKPWLLAPATTGFSCLDSTAFEKIDNTQHRKRCPLNSSNHHHLLLLLLLQKQLESSFSALIE